MVIYTVTHRDASGGAQTALHVEGSVASDNWEQLREACLEALKNSGELVLVVEKLEHYDFSLSIFICLLRRTARLLDKRLAIVGKLGDFVCLYSHGSRCFITGGSSCCQCENLFTQVRVP